MPFVAADGGAFWNTLNQDLWFYQPLLALLSTLLWGVYVYFTIRTFRQVKRQTDLQSEAFLIVGARTVDATQKISRRVPPEAIALHQKWRRILQTNLPNTIQPDKRLILKFTNRGRSDIIKWTLAVKARVEPGDYLDRKCNVRGEEETWKVEYLSHQDIVPLEGEIEVPIAVVGSFPLVNVSWLVSYVDTREKKYDRFGGDSNHGDINVLAHTAK